MGAVVAEIDGAREEHERAVVGLLRVGHVVVVVCGEVDARASLQRREEGRGHVRPQPAQARALALHRRSATFLCSFLCLSRRRGLNYTDNPTPKAVRYLILSIRDPFSNYILVNFNALIPDPPGPISTCVILRLD